MTGTRTVVRRVVCAAGIAAAIGAPALAGLLNTTSGPATVAQPVDCVAQPANPQCAQNGQNPPGPPGGSAGAPNLETGGGTDQQQHSGSHH